ncbi:MAG: transglutaminase domain-containing protein [Anaerolineales bacterium]|nr:transglutaminase domain-containing protein [Anaerolineales bacterium]
MSANIEPLEFYAKHGMMSDPGKKASLFSKLPDDIPTLCKVVQGLLIHEAWVSAYGVSMPENRNLESSIRTVSNKIDRILELSNHPLIEPRPAEHRLFSICRDFALLLTSMLRQKGIPARVRYGFATYFFPPTVVGYGDHVITEYWHAQEQRWVLVDAQLDELQCKAVHISFDPCDVPRDAYLTADVAWQRCRKKETDPKKFGFLPNYTGWWYVKGHLARDFAALNKIEMLCWDYWGIFERRDIDLPDDDLILLDQVARLSLTGNEAFDELHSLYLQDMRLRVPSVVKSWYVEDEQKYRLEEIVGGDLTQVKYL